MPLNRKGEKIMDAMKDTYGDKKGEQVFYASRNKGRIKNVEGKQTVTGRERGRRRLRENGY